MTRHPLAQIALTILLLPALAAAQTDDHLECYKIKDALKLKGTVDLTSPQFGFDDDCRISKAQLYCTPAEKTDEQVEDPTAGPIVPLPVSATAAPGARICYKVKCPKPAAPYADAEVTDQFGTRELSKFKAQMVCTPAVTGAAYCGDGTVGAGEECEDGDLGGATCESEGFASGTLACAAGCTFDISGCVPNAPSTCGNGTIDGDESCDGTSLGGASCTSLGFTLGGTLACTAGCGFDVSGCQGAAFPASGQTTCWGGGEIVIDCDGTGHDGEQLAGAALSYTDNGDGTVTDLNTGLMWEKLSSDGSIHGYGNRYSWNDAVGVHVAGLNAEAFAGYTDWRLPNIKELISIVDFERRLPAVDPVFNNGCTSGCTVLTCSCTASTASNSQYWSSTSYAGIGFRGSDAWLMDPDGFVDAYPKGSSRAVRAVRGGL